MPRAAYTDKSDTGNPVLDSIWDVMNKYHIIEFEQKMQHKVLEALGFEEGSLVQKVQAAMPPAAMPVAPVAQVSESAQKVTDVSGFYKVTGKQQVTFYATTPWPGFAVKAGWSIVGVTGLIGSLQVASDAQGESGVTSVTGLTSEPYNWFFTLESDTSQTIEGTHYVTGALLYPPGQEAYPSQQRMGPAYGFYMVIQNVPTFYFTAPPPEGIKSGWFMVGLPILGTCKISVYEGEIIETRSLILNTERLLGTAVLEPISGVIPKNTSTRVYVKGGPAMVVEPKFVTKFVAADLIAADLSKLKPIDLSANVIGGKFSVPQRDVGQDIYDQNTSTEKYTEIRDKGFATGAILSLFATGPQDQFMEHVDYKDSNWRPDIKQHTNFVMYQRVTPFPPPNPGYAGNVVSLELRPTVMGHLLSNMYFTCTIPRYGNSYSINENIGRALIKQVDLMVNEQVIETLYDDWYIIRDQIFLDADEQVGIATVVGGANSGISAGTANNDLNIVCPLEFFFCRRASHMTKDRERIRKPYFPLCAMWNQKMYVRFTFHPSYWWSNASGNFDIVNPKLITEEILLENSEKLYYQNSPLRYIVPKVKKESTLAFSGGSPQLQLTANFPVQSIFWFFRNKTYESIQDQAGFASGVYYDSRYFYGYTSDYIRTGIKLYFPSANNAPITFVDVISSAKITLNNVDILSTFQGSLYYSFKQPMEHSLSIPSKNIYMYSFGLSPKEYNQGGFLDFSKLNSQTSTLTLNFNVSYANQIIQGYNLYLFYYGYTVLDFRGGFAHLPFS
jgi:hypothetical protein